MSPRILVALVLAPLFSSCSGTRPLRPPDIDVPEGFKLEVAVTDLAAPTMIASDDQGRMLIAESAYGGGGELKVTRVEPNGEITILAQRVVFGSELPTTSVAFHEGQVYVVHAGTVSIIEEGGQLRNITTDLPGQGDPQANQLVFQDNSMYLSIGTVTNSRVVGEDNAVFGWLKKPELRDLYEVPCEEKE